MATRGKPTVDGVEQPGRRDEEPSESLKITRVFLVLFLLFVVLTGGLLLLWRDDATQVPATLEEELVAERHGAQPEASASSTAPPPTRATPAQDPRTSEEVGRRHPLPSGVPGNHHDPESFTQGLLWLNGSLYESKGLYGHSALREVNLEDGSVIREVRNDDKDFGEGVVNVGNGELLQILWRTGKGKRWSAQAGSGGHLRLSPPHFDTGLRDGWGLEVKDEGETLVVTTSGPEIYFLDRHTMRQKSMVTVKDAGVKVEMINELEMIDNELWANIYGMDCIARIHPDTGEVLGWINFDTILDRKEANSMARAKGIQRPDVFNGIAWDPDERRIFVTGKLWPYLFEIELVDQTSDAALKHARRVCIPGRNIFGG